MQNMCCPCVFNRFQIKTYVFLLFYRFQRKTIVFIKFSIGSKAKPMFIFSVLYVSTQKLCFNVVFHWGPTQNLRFVCVFNKFPCNPYVLFKFYIGSCVTSRDDKNCPVPIWESNCIMNDKCDNNIVCFCKPIARRHEASRRYVKPVLSMYFPYVSTQHLCFRYVSNISNTKPMFPLRFA